MSIMAVETSYVWTVGLTVGFFGHQHHGSAMDRYKRESIR